MVTKEFVIVNASGLHARPAALFSSEAAKFESDITVRRHDGEMIVDAKNVVSVLMLKVRPGNTIEVCIDGMDENDAAQALTRLVECNFEV